MEAIILAGGMGTRLRSVVTDIPKPMAPIQEKPFLSFILDQLLQQGIQKVILSTGYKHEVIEDYFGKDYKNLKILYSIENEPLGTGGAIRKAFQYVSEENVFIFNGDTMFRVDLREMYNFHLRNQADMTLALKNVQESSRYGIVETDSNRVVKFCEKSEKNSGLINGGVYLLKQDLYEKLQSLPKRFSFEKDFMETHCEDICMMGHSSDAYFIDIGIPDDYARANQELMLDS